MRPNLLTTACLGAALLPLGATRADDAPTPAPAASSSSGHTAASAPLASPGSAGQAPSAAPAPTPRAEASKAPPATHATPTPASSHPAASQAKAAAAPAAHHAAYPAPPAAHHAAAPQPHAAKPALSSPAASARQTPAPSHPAAPSAKPAPAKSAPVLPASHRPATAAVKPAPVPAPAVRSLPDYGGRDSIAGTNEAAQAAPALNPLAQAWRAFEALAIVLALVVGGLYGLRRLGVLKPDGSASAPAPLLAALAGFAKGTKPASSPAAAPAPAGLPVGAWMNIIGSQALPHAPGATLHLVSLGGKVLLLGATAQSVSLISEMDGDRPADPIATMDTGHAPFSFDGFLSQADHAPTRQANETEMLMHATTMRLQAMIARSEGQASGHRS